MGYSTTPLVDGFKAVSIPFSKIGKVVEGVKGVNLTDIVPEGADTFTGNVKLQRLNASGYADGGIIYAYHKNDKEPGRGGGLKYPNDGWYNDIDYINPGSGADVFLPEGSGVWIEGTTSFSITPSGEVRLDTINEELVNGFRLVGNPYPTSIKLTSFVPKGADTITGGVKLQRLNASGYAEGGIIYAYHKNDKEPGRGGSLKYPNDGWYNDIDYIQPDSAADIEIPSGSAVWVEGVSTFTIDVVTPFEDVE